MKFTFFTRDCAGYLVDRYTGGKPTGLQLVPVLESGGRRMIGQCEDDTPVVADKDYASPSAFTPESLLRESRRQKGLDDAPVPKICVLDPDGDIVRGLRAAGRANRVENWACYHTELYWFEEGGIRFGIIGCAVGAPYAVLIAEQLFVSGCELLISITSAGRLKPVRSPPYFVLIDRALRDEGTSFHYAAQARYSDASADLITALDGAFDDVSVPVLRGATWTTDAPYRETAAAIASRVAEGLLAVEMEAAALLAFAKAKMKRVVCFAHVTNQMGQAGDFEKGEADGMVDALKVIVAVARRCTAIAAHSKPHHPSV